MGVAVQATRPANLKCAALESALRWRVRCAGECAALESALRWRALRWRALREASCPLDRVRAAALCSFTGGRLRYLARLLVWSTGRMLLCTGFDHADHP
jgi:hypothetical protein